MGSHPNRANLRRIYIHRRTLRRRKRASFDSAFCEIWWKQESICRGGNEAEGELIKIFNEAVSGGSSKAPLTRDSLAWRAVTVWC